MSQPLDTDSAERMWSEYAAAHPTAIRACPDHTVERFGDSVELADELLALVIEGRKRATAELVEEFVVNGDPLPRIGSHWIACDGRGQPRVVLRTTELRLGTIASADESFAWDEGEDDRSLESWLTGHRRYWTRTCAARGATFSDDDEVVFERFTVVWPSQHRERQA